MAVEDEPEAPGSAHSTTNPLFEGGMDASGGAGGGGGRAAEAAVAGLVPTVSVRRKRSRQQGDTRAPGSPGSTAHAGAAAALVRPALRWCWLPAAALVLWWACPALVPRLPLLQSSRSARRAADSADRQPLPCPQSAPASPSGGAGPPWAGHAASGAFTAASQEELLERLKQAEEEAQEQGQLRLQAQLALVGVPGAAAGAGGGQETTTEGADARCRGQTAAALCLRRSAPGAAPCRAAGRATGRAVLRGRCWLLLVQIWPDSGLTAV
jgi:hypothetical protein